MKEFLRIVAEHYLRQSEGMTPARRAVHLASHLFVFPNRRSGLFMEHYLTQSVTAPVFAPRTTTIADIFTQFSDLRVLDRTELLFRLYTLYRKLSKSGESFDSFVFWGDILLGDFNDVDEYLTDARRLFTNIRDLKEIDLRYGTMTDEERAVVERFWKSVAQLSEERKKQVFEETWSILYDLYKTFREELRRDGLAYEGMLEREVIEEYCNGERGIWNSGDPRQLLHTEKIVFVGLTAITETERALMRWLQKEGVAEFCWDYDDPRLHDGEMKSQGAFFTRRNLQDFPDAIPEEERQGSLVPDSDREFNVYVVPSGVGQAQVAARQLKDWHIETPEEAFRTAVVLPAENLMLPMVYALPPEIPSYNITMGYSLKGTAVSAFVDHLAGLQQTQRTSEGEASFFYKSVLPLLTHHFTLSITGDPALELTHEINRQNRYIVPQKMLTHDSWLSLIFQPVETVGEAVVYLLKIFKYLTHCVIDDKEEERFTVFDREFLKAYIDVVEKLADLIGGVDWTFNVQTFFRLVQQLTRGLSVPFSGEPLSGLQLMGVLETRGLDFDRVILLSMNEGVFPAKTSVNTFIPMSLRHAFHLPTQQHKDAVFAYHFYRLLSRAKQVTLIYDSRSEGLLSGEESRYLKQLRYLYHIDLDSHTHFVQYEPGVVNVDPIEIEKSPEVRALLDRYRMGGDKHFSATAFKIYRNCTLEFYFSYIKDLREEETVKEEMASNVFGNIYHGVMEQLYRPFIGKEVQSDVLKKILANEPYIYNMVCDQFRKEIGVTDLTGYHQLVADIIVTYVKNTLKHDAKLSPLRIVALEKSERFTYEVSPHLKVNLKGIYDRIDVCRGALRIVDYKTSNPKNKLKLAASDEAFQVMLYGMMLLKFPSQAILGPQIHLQDYRLEGHLYHVRRFTDPDVSTALTGEEGQLRELRTQMDGFEEEFRLMVNELYDPAVPFVQADIKHCTFCPFTELCQRNPREF